MILRSQDDYEASLTETISQLHRWTTGTHGIEIHELPHMYELTCWLESRLESTDAQSSAYDQVKRALGMIAVNEARKWLKSVNYGFGGAERTGDAAQYIKELDRVGAPYKRPS